MKKLRIIVVLCLCVVLLSAFGSAAAQDETTPAFKVSEVTADAAVTLITKNFPADISYLVSLGDPENAASVTAVAKFNSKDGGALKVSVKIPETFRGKERLNIILTDPNGGRIEGSFANVDSVEESAADEPAEEAVEEPAAEEPAAEEAVEEAAADEPTEEAVEESAADEPAEEAVEEAAADEPTEEAVEETPVEEPTEEAVEETAAEEILQSAAPVCDYSVIPYVYIDSVVKDASVTFTTYNFPAESSFSVQMGVFNGTNPGRPQPPHHGPEPRDDEPRPEPPEPKPQPAPIGNQGEVVLTQLIRDLDAPAPSFNRPDGPEGPGPKPQPVASVPSFSGSEVGSFETGDGSSQTLTFEIPENLKGTGTIALWIADEGPCGFYAYNYFYNY